MVNSLLSADTRFAVKDGHRLFTLSPKTDLHSTIPTDCSSIGKVHFNTLLSGSVIAFGSTPIAGVKESLLIFDERFTPYSKAPVTRREEYARNESVRTTLPK